MFWTETKKSGSACFYKLWIWDKIVDCGQNSEILSKLYTVACVVVCVRLWLTSDLGERGWRSAKIESDRRRGNMPQMKQTGGSLFWILCNLWVEMEAVGIVRNEDHWEEKLQGARVRVSCHIESLGNENSIYSNIYSNTYSNILIYILTRPSKLWNSNIQTMNRQVENIHPQKILTPEKYSPLKNIHHWKYSSLKNIHPWEIFTLGKNIHPMSPDDKLSENIWFVWSKTSYDGDR